MLTGAIQALEDIVNTSETKFPLEDTPVETKKSNDKKADRK